MVSNMNYFSFFAATLGLLFTVVHAQNATVITTNTAGVSYEAILPNSATTNIRGSVVAQSGANDTGVLFQVNFDGFPSEGGPFLYHIHNNRITDGNCSTAGSHLDPFARGETPSCDSTYPATCQVGDLSGKHGKINDTSFSANYVDDFVSTTAGNPSFMGNRSLVIHYANKTIITCADWNQISSGSNSTTSNSTSTSSATGNASASSTSTTSPVTATGAATALAVNFGVVLVAGLMWSL